MEHHPATQGTVLTENLVDNTGKDVQLASYADSEKIQMIVVGDMDMYTAPGFKQMLLMQEGSYPDAKTIEIDLCHATYIDSTFLGVLVGTCRRQAKKVEKREDFSFKVTVADRNIDGMFRVLGLDKMFEMEFLEKNK